MNRVVKGTLLLFSVLLIFGSFFVLIEIQNKNEEISILENKISNMEKKQKYSSSATTDKKVGENGSNLVVEETNKDETDNQKKSVAEKLTNALYSYSAEDVTKRNEAIKETTTNTLHNSLIVDTIEPDTSTTMKVDNIRIYQTENDSEHLLVSLEQTTRIIDSETRMEITLKLSLQQVDNCYLVNNVEQLSAISI
ncbi:TPA: hypothetical protein IP990_002786 [Listeria monocytogenes]|nr:hypothetical protein [Listeria monocytogenes]